MFNVISSSLDERTLTDIRGSSSTRNMLDGPLHRTYVTIHGEPAR